MQKKFLHLHSVGAFYDFGLRLSTVGKRVGLDLLSPQDLLRVSMCTRQESPNPNLFNLIIGLGHKVVHFGVRVRIATFHSMKLQKVGL